MSQLSNEEIYQEVGKIVAQFNLYRCKECAVAVMQWLKKYGLSGRILKIQTAYGEGLSKEDWLNDFQCPSGKFLINYVDLNE